MNWQENVYSIEQACSNIERELIQQMQRKKKSTANRLGDCQNPVSE